MERSKELPEKKKITVKEMKTEIREGEAVKTKYRMSSTITTKAYTSVQFGL